MDDEKDRMSRGRDPIAIQMPKPIKGTGRYPPSVILEQHSTISSYDSAIPFIISAEEKGLTMPPSTHQNLPSLVVTAPAPAPARLIPSAPLPRPQTALSTQTISTLPTTLEAILLERKRRAPNTNASSSSSPVPSGPHVPPRLAPSAGSFGLIHSSGKGARFKSHPLSGSDRAGVVVAEQVKAARKSDSEDVQSPDQEQREDKQMEKAGFGKD
jgi:metal transporter CNNM